MTKQTWIFASVLSVLVVIGFIGLSARQQTLKLREALRKLESAQVSNDRNTQAAEQLKQDLEETQEQLKETKLLVEQLQKEKEQVTKAQKTLEDQMRSAIESKDITISELQGKLTVNILDRILFDSGEAILKPEGEVVLTKIASILEQFPNRQIHVIGHTDNIPIRSSARSRFPSNWELSTARATAAVRFLQEKAGVDPRRLGAVGYGEFHPIAENTNVEGRAKNRRIALVVLPEVLSGADIPPSPSQTNAPPVLSAPLVQLSLNTNATLAKLTVETNTPAVLQEGDDSQDPDNREEPLKQ